MPMRNPGQPAATRRKIPQAVIEYLDRLAVWPVAASTLVIALLLIPDGHISSERPFLLMGLNFVFATLVSLFIALKVGQSFMAEGRPGLLFLGCGALIWGLAGLVGVIAATMPSYGAWFNANILVTIHNTCAWVSAFCHLMGAALCFNLRETIQRPRIWLSTAYVGILGLAALITLASLWNWTPLFFQPGQGGTLTRQLVLGSAITMFVLAAILLRLMHRQASFSFAHWCSLALFLFAAGLTGTLFQKVTGSALGWAGRGAQALGGVYMLVAALRSSHGFRLLGIPLEQAAGGRRARLGVAVAIAVASTASAAAVRMFFLHDLGATFSYVTFIPAVILAAFMGGYGPGLMTALLSTLLVLFFWTEPVGWHIFHPSSDFIEAALFLISGLLVALVARATHRVQSRAILAETEVEQSSERIRAAEALRASEERLVNVIEATEAGVWDWDIQSGEVVFNERWAEIVGYTLAELAPVSIQTWLNLAHPEDLRKSEKQLAEVFARVRPLYDIDCRMKHRNGGWVWVHDRGKVIEWTEDGKPRRMTGSHTDITARKQAEEQRAELARELQVILETVPVGIAKVIDRKQVWINRGFEELLHYPKEEIITQSTRKVFPSEEAYAALGQAAYPLLAQGGTFETEQLLVRKDGTPVLVKLTGKAVDSADLAMGSIWTLKDITERKHLEEDLRERENNLRNLVETTSDMIVVASIEGRVLFTNGHFERRLGYGRDDLAAMHLLDLHPPEMRREAEEIFTAMLRGERDTCPLPVMTRQGMVLPVETRAWAGKWGGQECVFGFIKDLSAEQEAQQRFEKLFRHNPAPMALSTLLDRALIDVNDAFLAKLGYAKGEVIGKTARELGLFRPQAEKAEALLPAIFSQRSFSGIELQVAAKDGRILDGLFSGEVINSQGQDSLLTVMIDITERKQMEDTLRLRDATLTAIIENQPGLLWLKDSDGRFLAVNTPFARACGLDHCEDVIGKTDLEIWPVELASKYIADDKAVMQSGTSLVVEEPVWERGVVKWYETFKTPILNNQCRVIGTTGYSRDITERKRAEEEVRRAKDEAVAADEAKSKLLSTVAHEFRTPLSLLQSSLDILDRYGERLNKEQRTEQDKYIRSASRQLSILADTVLTYRTMAADALRGAPEPCDIRELSLAIADETHAAWSVGHDFKVNVDLECDVLLLDALLFRRILENLLANAFQYTPPAGSVSLDVLRENGWLRLTITDQGIGMEEKDREQAFESFHRGRNVGQRRGMGLGLSIVREALLQTGGTVSLTSAVDAGTTVEVAIPWREVHT